MIYYFRRVVHLLFIIISLSAFSASAVCSWQRQRVLVGLYAISQPIGLYCRSTLYPSLCEGRTNAPPSPLPARFSPLSDEDEEQMRLK